MKYYLVGIKGSGLHECLALFSDIHIKDDTDAVVFCIVDLFEGNNT